MRIGYSAPYNEDCEVRDNLIVNGGLEIKDYRKVVDEGNLVLGKSDPRPAGDGSRSILRPNRYDPNRANLAVFNWAKQPSVELAPKAFLKPGGQRQLVHQRSVQAVGRSVGHGPALRHRFRPVNRPPRRALHSPPAIATLPVSAGRTVGAG